MMHRILLAIVAALALTMWVVGCQSAAAVTKASSKPALPLDARPTPRAGLSAPEINRAGRLSVAKCVRCHQLYNPAAYGDAQWRSWMTKMSKKAHLKLDQAELLSQYFEAFRAPSSPVDTVTNGPKPVK